jgi:hypothetical protein
MMTIIDFFLDLLSRWCKAIDLLIPGQLDEDLSMSIKASEIVMSSYPTYG